MAKTLKAKIKLQIEGGKATPAPPIGPALGQHGVNIGDFINKFNEATKDKLGMILPVEINVWDDRSYDFVVKAPVVADLLRKAAGLEKGSGQPNKNKIGKPICVFMNVAIKPEKQEKFLEFAKKSHEIAECHHVTGPYSVILKAYLKEISHLEELVGKVQFYGNTETYIIMSSPIENAPI